MTAVSAPDLSDAHTRRILELVQKNGRITVQAIADELCLSTAPCWRRLNELEGSGVIKRYAALVDRRSIGLNSCMFTQISLQHHTEHAVARFERAVQAAPEILECWVTAGSADYLLKIYVPDPLAFDLFLNRFLLKLDGVKQLTTSVALREVKNETFLDVSSACLQPRPASTSLVAHKAMAKP